MAACSNSGSSELEKVVISCNLSWWLPVYHHPASTNLCIFFSLSGSRSPTLSLEKDQVVIRPGGNYSLWYVHWWSLHISSEALHILGGWEGISGPSAELSQVTKLICCLEDYLLYFHSVNIFRYVRLLTQTARISKVPGICWASLVAESNWRAHPQCTLWKKKYRPLLLAKP